MGEVDGIHFQNPFVIGSGPPGTNYGVMKRAFEDGWGGVICLDAGSEGIAAINTIQSVMGVNLKTLRPEPSVEGYSTPGGYSSKAVKPIALARVMQLAKMLREEYPNH